VQQAADNAGVKVRTLYNWLREPFFAAEYTRLRRESVRQATAMLQRSSAGAASVLLEIASDTDAPAAARVAAASKILDFAVRAIELDDIHERLERLEGIPVVNDDGN
jgi:hypothetical protein